MGGLGETDSFITSVSMRLVHPVIQPSAQGPFQQLTGEGKTLRRMMQVG
jgi:hypothetical protein